MPTVDDPASGQTDLSRRVQMRGGALEATGWEYNANEGWRR
jgi:hypothetical protein